MRLDVAGLLKLLLLSVLDLLLSVLDLLLRVLKFFRRLVRISLGAGRLCGRLNRFGRSFP